MPVVSPVPQAIKAEMNFRNLPNTLSFSEQKNHATVPDKPQGVSQKKPPMNPFSEQVIALIRRIPSGTVTTYGLIAAAAGNHCGARQVSRILHSFSTIHQLPWHRVVNRNGQISPRMSMGHLEQRRLLEAEGILFGADGRIDLGRFLWLPS
jgi:methylated-DNA-protein-cysteine methyltransferase related protein